MTVEEAALNDDPTSKKVPRQIAAQILESLNNIQFGAVQITIHNGEVVQIDRTEKIRLGANNK